MNTTEIIEAVETLSVQEQKSITSYFILKFMNPDKKDLLKLLNFSDNDESELIHNPLKNFYKSKGILKDVDLSDISEDDIYLQED